MDRLESGRESMKPILPGYIQKGVQKYRDSKDLFHFIVRQRWLGYEVSDQPWLDEGSSAVFLQMIENSKSYLEYGSGGSTVLAAKLNKPFISVDTDPYFLEAVRRKIGKLAANQHLEHWNIGWTREWGCPVFQTPSARNSKRWKAYADIPWRYVEKGLLPDTVMVDGRFRVAAALTSCVHLVNAPDSRILVDDYIMRPHYHAIADYAELIDIRGRMAIFKPPSTCSQDIQEAIDRYSLDWR